MVRFLRPHPDSLCAGPCWDFEARRLDGAQIRSFALLTAEIFLCAARDRRSADPTE